MSPTSLKACWLAAGTLLGVSATLLLGAAQPVDDPAERFEVDLDLTFGAVVITARDRQENTLLLYMVPTDEDEDQPDVELPMLWEIDLDGLGEDTIQARLKVGAREDAENEPGESE